MFYVSILSNYKKSSKAQENIINNLGGLKKLNNLSIKHFSSIGINNLKFVFLGSRKANHVDITLNENKLYDVVFTKYNGKHNRRYFVKLFNNIKDLNKVFEEVTDIQI